MDERRWKDVSGQMLVDGTGQTKQGGTLDGMMTNIGQNWNETKLEPNELRRQQRCRAIRIHELCNDNVQKRRKNFFFLLRVFVFFLIFFFFFFQSCYKGYSLHDYKLKKHTGVHSLDANLKTHVQGKLVYVGLHHLM
jgi:hypothetical protein